MYSRCQAARASPRLTSPSLRSCMAHAEQLARQGQACWYRLMEKLQLKAAILDWAGTVVDHGSRAPMGAFVRAFAQFGVAISIADARGPMGMAKWDHIRAVGQ